MTRRPPKRMLSCWWDEMWQYQDEGLIKSRQTLPQSFPNRFPHREPYENFSFEKVRRPFLMEDRWKHLDSGRFHHDESGPSPQRQMLFQPFSTSVVTTSVIFTTL